ncbi:MAG TPA: ISL3 family transposase [Actinomycetota bacterium]|nr:ISL3 family transposase [Actinomycetota bacterium]
MTDQEFLEAALGLEAPWRLDRADFDPEAERVDLYLAFERGARFPCPVCERASCPVRDTKERTWRHLNLFQHHSFVHARVPRVICPDHGVHQVHIPWAREGSGFTLLFEALVMGLLPQMPVRSAARFLGEHDTRIWRVIHYYVGRARSQRSMANVRAIGVDETSALRGQDYITLVVDLDTRAVLFATPGRGADTLAAFAKDLSEHGGDPANITEVCCDMSHHYIQGTAENFPNAQITFDRYHIVQMVSRAVDEVRRHEASSRPKLLRNTRYLWLKNPENLTVKQAATLEYLQTREDTLYTVRAYRWRLLFNAFFEQPSRDQAEAYLQEWCKRVNQSRLLPFKGVVRTIRQHWEGILRWHTSRINNGLLEGINSLVQAAKRKARGYRTKANLIVMTYLIAGKLQLVITHTK